MKFNQLIVLFASVTLLATGSPVQAQDGKASSISASVTRQLLAPCSISNGAVSVELALATQTDKHKSNTWPHTNRGDWTYANSNDGTSDENSTKPTTSQAPSGTTTSCEATDYVQLTAVLLNALKEQREQIETLKKQAVVFSQRAAESEIYSLRRIAQAEAANATLEHRLRLLEARGIQADAGH